MASRYRGKVLSRVLNDGVNTYYSDHRLDGLLGGGERYFVEARTSNVSGTLPTLTITIETSNDGVNWTVRSSTRSPGYLV